MKFSGVIPLNKTFYVWLNKNGKPETLEHVICQKTLHSTVIP